MKKGTKHTKESNRKNSEAHKGKKHLEETKRKMSKSHQGKKFSEEHRRKISEAQKGFHPKTEFKKGHKPLKETIEKIKKSKKGYRHTEITKRKIGKALKGKMVGEKNPMYGISGENHPSWLGGKSFEPYNKSFNNKFKRAIRKRDNQICMMCGIHREKLNEALTIHHINYNKLLSIPQNCISLCRKCHAKTNYNRKHWITFFQDLLSKLYNYKYSENQEIILNFGEKQCPSKAVNNVHI